MDSKERSNNRKLSCNAKLPIQMLLFIIIFSFLISFHPTTCTNVHNHHSTNTTNTIFSSSINSNSHRILSNFTNKKRSNLWRIEAGLAQARAAITKATNESINDQDYVPSGSVYRNPNTFHRSYMEMNKRFKIYVYEDGDPPVFHNAPCYGILRLEGIFINDMELSGKGSFYFLPFSIITLINYIYTVGSHDLDHVGSHDLDPMYNTVRDYINVSDQKYPYWKRSLGADHFMLPCHDWGPKISSSIPHLYKNSIRALCNANTSEGFKLSRDVSIPEIYLPRATTQGLVGGPSVGIM